MNRTFRFLAVVLFTALIFACSGKDEPTGPEPTDPIGIAVADLAGGWTATKIEYTNKASNEQVDGIAQGEIFTLSIQSDGQFEGKIGNQSAPLCLIGTLAIEDDILNIAHFLGPAQISLLGNTLTLTFMDTRYDFEGEGFGDPAILLLVMQKNS